LLLRRGWHFSGPQAFCPTHWQTYCRRIDCAGCRRSAPLWKFLVGVPVSTYEGFGLCATCNSTWCSGCDRKVSAEAGEVHVCPRCGQELQTDLFYGGGDAAFARGQAFVGTPSS
jgi:hypothetical protein